MYIQGGINQNDIIPQASSNICIHPQLLLIPYLFYLWEIFYKTWAFWCDRFHIFHL